MKLVTSPFSQPNNSVDVDRLIDGLGGRRSGTGWAARCPSHDDRNPSLSISTREGRVLVHCHSGCEQASVLDALRRLALWPEAPQAPRSSHAPRQRPQPVLLPVNHGLRDYALRLWEEALTLRDKAWPPVMMAYFRSRGLEPFDPCLRLRFHPRAPHGAGRHHPAFLALVTDLEDQTQGIQATFLKEDGSGKADVDPPRKTYGSATGGSVRLLEGDDVLIIGEGIESTLSAMQVAGEGGYALLGSSGLKNIRLPEVYRQRRVIIAADNDANGTGQRAACEAARRLVQEQGFVDVRLVMPPKVGEDFNDRLRSAS